MRTLWTFGCSFTAEYDPIDGIFFPFENDFDKYKKWRGGNLPSVWPTILGDKLYLEKWAYLFFWIQRHWVLAIGRFCFLSYNQCWKS